MIIDRETENKYILALKEVINDFCYIYDISINKLANDSLLTQSTVENILMNKSMNPKILTLLSISNGLNISLSDFFYYIERKMGIIQKRKIRKNSNNFEFFFKGSNKQDFLEIVMVNYVRAKINDIIIPFYVVGSVPDKEDFLQQINSYFFDTDLSDFQAMKQQRRILYDYFQNRNVGDVIIDIKAYFLNVFLKSLIFYDKNQKITFPSDIYFVNTTNFLQYIILLDQFISKDERKKIDYIGANYVYLEKNNLLIDNIFEEYL